MKTTKTKKTVTVTIIEVSRIPDDEVGRIKKYMRTRKAGQVTLWWAGDHSVEAVRLTKPLVIFTKP